jgi:hypothetical protein
MSAALFRMMKACPSTGLKANQRVKLPCRPSQAADRSRQPWSPKTKGGPPDPGVITGELQSSSDHECVAILTDGLDLHDAYT